MSRLCARPRRKASSSIVPSPERGMSRAASAREAHRRLRWSPLAVCRPRALRAQESRPSTFVVFFAPVVRPFIVSSFRSRLLLLRTSPRVPRRGLVPRASARRVLPRARLILIIIGEVCSFCMKIGLTIDENALSLRINGEFTRSSQTIKSPAIDSWPCRVPTSTRKEAQDRKCQGILLTP